MWHPWPPCWNKICRTTLSAGVSCAALEEVRKSLKKQSKFSYYLLVTKQRMESWLWNSFKRMETSCTVRLVLFCFLFLWFVFWENKPLVLRTISLFYHIQAEYRSCLWKWSRHPGLPTPRVTLGLRTMHILSQLTVYFVLMRTASVEMFRLCVLCYM